MSEIRSATWAAPIGLHTTLGLPSHKRSNGRDGYIYVVALSTGLVKVGKTVNPRGRVGSHISHAHKVGADVVNVWLSPQHENFAKNERALIRQLGVAERGAEYFRCDYTEAVKIAESLSFIIPTPAGRKARDERLDAESKAQTDLLVQSLGLADPPKYRRIIVPMDAKIWALETVFGPRLPSSAALELGDEEGLRDKADVIARLIGVRTIDVLDWSFLELLEQMATAEIKSAVLDWKIRALTAGRYDLTDPNYLATEDDDASLIGEDEFCYYAEPASLIEDEDDPRSVLVGIGSKLGVESACVAVRNGGPHTEVLLGVDELSRLIEQLSDVRDVMRTEVLT